MTWTNNPPTKPGWYWFKFDAKLKKPTCIAQVKDGLLTTGLIVSLGVNWTTVECICDRNPRCQWSSEPLPEPEEETGSCAKDVLRMMREDRIKQMDDAIKETYFPDKQ